MALSRPSFPETVTMTQRSGATWRATTPHLPPSDAVEAALERGAGELSCRALFDGVARMIDAARKLR